MHDIKDVILAVIASIGLGVFFGMPLPSLHLPQDAPHVRQRAAAHEAESPRVSDHRAGMRRGLE
jgi:hypothetical protein